MKIYWCLIIIVIFFSARVRAQEPPTYPEAPEVWSKPVPIGVIWDNFAGAGWPSVTTEGKTLYFGGVLVTQRSDTGWSMPKWLPQQITDKNKLPERPVISPDGKRLFFTQWTNAGWQMFYADWDPAQQDWGPVTSPGPPVTNPHEGWGTDWGCRENAGAFLDDTTLIYTICGETFITHWHPTTARWDTAVSWPYIFPNSSWDGLRYIGDYGISVTPDRKKVYLSVGRNDTTRDGKYYANSDLAVTYRNPQDTSMDGKLGKTYTLNLSLLSDSLYFAGIDSTRFEAFPAITADGKTLFFEANYQGDYTIYVSHLLIDENGNPVSDPVEKPPPTLPTGFKLDPAYPNPFNPTTMITYTLPVKSHIRLSIYDILGRQVRMLTEGVQAPGVHHLKVNGAGLASGVYLLFLQTPQGSLTRKITLLK